MSAHRIAIASFSFAALWLLSGCGSNPQGPYGISGTVHVDGQPLEKGNIGFQPTQEQPTSSGAVIAGGKFTIPRESGLVVGTYRVVINAPVPGTGGKPIAGELPGEAPAPPKELIPPGWNVSSEHTIEVKPEGPFVFPFEIATKRK